MIDHALTACDSNHGDGWGVPPPRGGPLGPRQQNLVPREDGHTEQQRASTGHGGRDRRLPQRELCPLPGQGHCLLICSMVQRCISTQWSCTKGHIHTLAQDVGVLHAPSRAVGGYFLCKYLLLWLPTAAMQLLSCVLMFVLPGKVDHMQ